LKKDVEEHEKVPLLLSKKQIDLIIDHTIAEDDLVEALQIAEVSGGRRKVFFTLEDLEHLNGHVAAAANHCDDRKLERELDALYEHIDKVEREYDVRY
jgi:hypothetical protein